MKKDTAETARPARIIGRRRLISAAFPNMNEEKKEAAAKKALMRPTSKYEAPRDLAKTGIKMPDIIREEFARNWIRFNLIGHRIRNIFPE